MIFIDGLVEFFQVIKSLPEFDVVTKIILSTFAGLLIGVERERAGRDAGTRTFLIVCLASTLVMIVSEGFWFKYQHLGSDSIMRVDGARLAAQLLSGCGFIGAACVFRADTFVRGLTTAACVWMACAIGITIGFGEYVVAYLCLLITLFALVALRRVGDLVGKDRYLSLSVKGSSVEVFDSLMGLFKEQKLRVADVRAEYSVVGSEVRYDFMLTGQQRRVGQGLLSLISKIEGITFVKYK